MHATAKPKTKKLPEPTPESRARLAAAMKARWAKRGMKVGTPAAATAVKPGHDERHSPRNGAEANGAARGLQLLDPATIRRSPFNRSDFDADELQTLIADVKERGVVQPGIVRPVTPPAGKIAWELIAGERRWTAASKAKVLFPATVRDVGDTEALELQAVENMHREDLNPIDEAEKYEQLRAAYVAEGLTATAAIARIEVKTGKATATIYERLSLMKLVSNVRVLIRRGRLPASHAALLTKVSDPKMQMELAGEILKPKSGEDEKGIMSFRGAVRIVGAAVQREKNLATYSAKADEFRKNGLRVLTSQENKQWLDCREGEEHWWIKGRDAIVKADTMCDRPGANYREYRKLWKKAPPEVLGRLPDGRAVIVYLRAEADAAVTAAGKLKRELGSRGSTRSAAEVLKDQQHAARQKEFVGVVAASVKHIENNLDSAEFWRFFALSLVGQWRSDPIKRAAKRRGYAKGGAASEDIRRRIPAMGVHELRGLCAEIMLWNDVPSHYASGWGSSIKAAAAMARQELSPWGKEGGGVQASGDDDEDEEDNE